MKQELNKAVKGYVESQQLSNEQLQDLTQMLNARLEKNKPNSFVTTRAIASVLVLSLALGMFWGFGMNYHIINRLFG